jgi:hypothetical protein
MAGHSRQHDAKWSQSSVWFVDDLRKPIPAKHAHLHNRTVWLSGIPQSMALSPTIADQVCDLVEPAVAGKVIAVTIRIDESADSRSAGNAMIFASLDEPALIDAAERAELSVTDEDGGTVKLMLQKVTVDDELSLVRTLRLRGKEGGFCPPSNSLAVLNVPNGGLGVGDNRKLAELFLDALLESEVAPEGATVVAVVVVNLPGLRNDRAQVVLNSPETVACAVDLGVTFWDPASNQDVLLKVKSLAAASKGTTGGPGQTPGGSDFVDMSPRGAVDLEGAAGALSRVEVEEQANSLWEEASTRQATLALEWWNRVQNLDEDELAMRREEREAREAEEAAAKEELEAQEAEAEAEAKEEAAWLAEERMRREQEEAEAACRRSHEEELEAQEAIKVAAKEEEEANAAQAFAKDLQTKAREAQMAAKKEKDEADEAAKVAEKEVKEAEEAEAAAVKEEEEANAALAAASTAESEARSLYMKAEVPWAGVEEVEAEVVEAEAAVEAAGKNKKKREKAELFLQKVKTRCEKRKRLEELKAEADKEVQEAEEARAIATKEREEAFAAKRDAAIEASEAEDAEELAQAELKKANDAMRIASFERAEAVQAKRNAEREVEEAAQAKRDALREMEDFEASRDEAQAERDRADEARQVAIKERAEADEATAVAIKERSEANAARTKWATKQAAKQGMKWRRKAKVDGGGQRTGKGKGSRSSNSHMINRSSRKPKPPKFGKTRLWSASGRRPLTSTVNFGNTEAYAAIDSGRTHTKIIVGLDCALVPTGDAAEAAKAALAAQTARARVDRRAGASGETDTAAQVAELESLAGKHGGGAIKAVLTPRSLVSQIVHQDAWFHRNKKSGANGDWARLSQSGSRQSRPSVPIGQDLPLPELSPRYKAIMDARRQEVLASGQDAMALPINMRLPQLSSRSEPPSRLPSDLW